MSQFTRVGWSLLANYLRAGVEFVYPRECALCQTGLPGGLRGVHSRLCAACVRDLLEWRPEHWCQRCGGTLGPHLDPWGGCFRCREEKFRFERVLRVGTYEGRLREAVVRAKQAGGETLAAALGELLWEREETALVAGEIDLVTFVPQHWWHKVSRRHNAAETLARVLAGRLHVACPGSILRKVRRTPPQATLLPTARRQNLRQAFAVEYGRELQGASILLVDDVMTTGSTAQEISRSLLDAGASRVWLAVVARGLGRK